MSRPEKVVSYEPPQVDRDPQRAVVRADRPIGAILVDEGKITPAEVERALHVAKTKGLRFGEAAVRLGLVTESEVRLALSKQYDYSVLAPEHDGEGRPSRELVAAFAPYHPRTEEIRALRTQLLI